MWYWLRLGFISFGGPAGQIAIMHQDLVEKKRWISEKHFLHALNYCMLLPGPEAQQLATYIGWRMHRTWGGLVAGGLFILPSLAILMLLAWVYLAFGHLPPIAGILYGFKPAVVAIVAYAAYRIGSRVLHSPLLWFFCLAAFAAVTFFSIPFPYVVLVAGVSGYASRRLLADKANHGAASAEEVLSERSLIEDHASPLRNDKSRLARAARILAAGIALWGSAMLALAFIFGWHAVLTQMGWFFTKAALLTFGGAYAVLPYVYQGTVQTYGWLSPAQMMDGLALGETTPGPLIMVVAFAGFVGGWTHAVFGADHLLLGGMVAAGVVTFFTFLPSFLFIFLGGPLVEATQGKSGFTAPLTAITAAVVGVILNLAVFFTYHIVWPQGWDGSIDWFSAVIAIAGLLALAYFRLGIIPLILACGILGFVYRMLV